MIGRRLISVSDRELDPIEDALDWLNSASTGYRPRYGEHIRTKIIPLALKQFEDMKSEIDLLRKKLAAAKAYRGSRDEES